MLPRMGPQEVPSPHTSDSPGLALDFTSAPPYSLVMPARPTERENAFKLKEKPLSNFCFEPQTRQAVCRLSLE